jgi:hypothetical protein
MARSADEVALHIFDDGSLDESDWQLLSDNLGDFQIHKFKEYYDKVSESISKFPTCLEYRRRSPFALKLLDLPLSSPNIFVNLDSDIYFFRAFKGLNRVQLEDPDFVGARDLVTHCFGLKFHERYFNKRIPVLPDKVNVGFIYMHRRIYDLDYLEWLLKNIFEVKKSDFPREAEQYAFAGLAAKKKSFIWDRDQIVCLNPHRKVKVDDSTIAIHFHHTVREKFFPAIEHDNLDQVRITDNAVPLKLESTTYHSVIRAAADRIWHKYALHL